MIRNRDWLAFILTCAVMAWIAEPVLAAVGRTPGTFSVSPTGAATYTIPLWAPPGPHGLQPNLALVYNSQAGGGPAGLGWTIAGLSSITRCNPTYAQDSAPAPISLTYADRFCLDGQRLRLTSSEDLTTYGRDLTTYQTEIANFSNVTAHGTTGVGPSSFTVKGKDGLTYEYGVGGNSQVLLNGTATAWMLDKVTDRSGNSMTVTYVAPDTHLVGAAVPDTISWTPSGAGSSSYIYTMKFAYTPTTSLQSAGYIAGNQTQLSDELLGVVVKNGTTVVKNYVLHYTSSSVTGRLELDWVKECADAAASNCLPQTNLTYQPGVLGAVTPTTSSGSGTTNGILKTVDIDGDGRSDLIFATTNANGTNQWWVQLATSGGFSAPINTGASTPVGVSVLMDSFDGSPGNEILAPNGSVWNAYKLNSSTNSFTSIPTNVQVVAGALYASADVDGDGLPDLIYVLNTFDGNVQVAHNTSSVGSISFLTAVANAVPVAICSTACVTLFDGNNQVQYTPVKKFDFDGDGRQDLVLYLNSFGSRTAYTLLSRGAGGFALGASVLDSGNTQTVLPVNWNDDNCTDLIVGASVLISKCNGTNASGVTLPNFPFMAIDWDGDGRTDAIVQTSTTTSLNQSTGTGVLTTTLSNFGVGGGVTLLDVDGDGLDDVACSCGTNHAIQIGLHNGAGHPPDLMTLVTDGYGNSASPTYVSIAQNNSVYTRDTNAAFPYQNYTGPKYVASQVSFSDPTSSSGGTYVQSFSYKGAWVNLQGRGFLGFEQVQQYDSRNLLWESFLYDVAFPWTGILDVHLVSHDPARTQRLSRNYINRVSTVLDGTANNQRTFVYVNDSAAETYEVGGPKDGQLIKVVETTYAYGADNYNYGQPTSVVTTVTDKDSASPYLGSTWSTTTTNTTDVDASQWCLNLLTNQKTDYTASNGEKSVTRFKSFTPDTTNCRYSQIVTEPNSSVYKVIHDLVYDAFGNIFTDTTTGIGMAARQTKVDWGATGQFPTTVTDPNGAQTVYGYDLSVGHVNTRTDQNGLTTTFIYGDGFGRVTQEQDPDGTTVNYVFNSCGGAVTCLALGQSSKTRSVLDKNSAVITKSITTYDRNDRPIEVSNLSLSGAFSNLITTYDSLGNFASRSSPFLDGGNQYFESYFYDALSRITSTQRPIKATNTNLETTRVQYQGDTTVLTDANQNSRTLVRDPNGWLRETLDAAGYAIKPTYDAAGSKIGVTDSLGNTLWSATVQYGIVPMTVNTADADMGPWSYSYDALGELTSWTDAKQRSFTAQYDALARMTDRYEPDLYTHWTWGTSKTAHELGKLHGVCTGTGTNPNSCATNPGYAETETYDSIARLSARAIQIPGDATYTYSWTYDPVTGLNDTLTYPADAHGYRLAIKYGYANGLLNTLTDTSDSPNKALWTANALNERGQFTQETLGNNVVVNHSFDAVTGLINTTTAGLSGGAALQNNSYLFDNVGNFTQRQDNQAGTTENIFVDSLNRLDHTVGDSNTQMGYDSMGRTSTWAANGASANVDDYVTAQAGCTYYSYAQPHALRKETAGSHWTIFCYDQNGNRVQTTDNYASGDMSQFTWTSFNQLASMTATSTSGPTNSNQLFYDHNHQRWKQIASYSGAPETTEYIGGLLERMTNTSTTAYRYYVPAGSSTIVYSRSSAGTNAVYYLSTDHLGSTATMSDQNGALVARNKFAALGWSEASAADRTALTNITRHEFTGQEGIDNASLVNMNGRIYEPSGSRFLSPDPTIPDPADTRSQDRYSYVNHNPLTFVDPTGFEACGVSGDSVTVCGGGGGGGLIGGGAGGLPGNTGSAGAGANAESQAIDNYRYPKRIDPYLARAFNRALAKPAAPPPRRGFWGRASKVGLPLIAVMVVVTVIAPEGPGEAVDAAIIGAEGAAEGGAAAEGAELTLFRGVASDSPAFENALNGVANPIGGEATMLEHSLGNTASNFTSWTSDYEVALEYATTRGATSGAVLTNTFAEGVATQVAPSVEAIMGESEFLVSGPVSGALVVTVP